MEFIFFFSSIHDNRNVHVRKSINKLRLFIREIIYKVMLSNVSCCCHVITTIVWMYDVCVFVNVIKQLRTSVRFYLPTNVSFTIICLRSQGNFGSELESMLFPLMLTCLSDQFKNGAPFVYTSSKNCSESGKKNPKIFLEKKKP